MEKIDYEKNMKYIAKMYKDIKKEISDNTRPPIKAYMLDKEVEFVNFIEIMLSLIPAEYERIIRKDYLEPRNVKWWQEFYKKSTYYRRKREAVEVFVDCLSL